jgi:hypothetical protein
MAIKSDRRKTRADLIRELDNYRVLEEIHLGTIAEQAHTISSQRGMLKQQGREIKRLRHEAIKNHFNWQIAGRANAAKGVIIGKMEEVLWEVAGLPRSPNERQFHPQIASLRARSRSLIEKRIK